MSDSWAAALSFPSQAGQEVRDDADPQTRGWFASSLTSSGSSLALAFLCTKALLPIRVPLTLAITPPVARFAASHLLPVVLAYAP